jgi:hypothetical protein
MHRVALTAGAAAQLPVDTARLVPLGSNDVQPAAFGHVHQLSVFVLQTATVSLASRRGRV